MAQPVPCAPDSQWGWGVYLTHTQCCWLHHGALPLQWGPQNLTREEGGGRIPLIPKAAAWQRWSPHSPGLVIRNPLKLPAWAWGSHPLGAPQSLWAPLAPRSSLYLANLRGHCSQTPGGWSWGAPTPLSMGS